jgi:hypothetical protein
MRDEISSYIHCMGFIDGDKRQRVNYLITECYKYLIYRTHSIFLFNMTHTASQFDVIATARVYGHVFAPYQYPVLDARLLYAIKDLRPINFAL